MIVLSQFCKYLYFCGPLYYALRYLRRDFLYLQRLYWWTWFCSQINTGFYWSLFFKIICLYFRSYYSMKALLEIITVFVHNCSNFIVIVHCTVLYCTRPGLLYLGYCTRPEHKVLSQNLVVFLAQRLKNVCNCYSCLALCFSWSYFELFWRIKIFTLHTIYAATSQWQW